MRETVRFLVALALALRSDAREEEPVVSTPDPVAPQADDATPPEPVSEDAPHRCTVHDVTWRGGPECWAQGSNGIYC